MTVVLVPVRGFSTGKTRWPRAMDRAHRHALVRRLADVAVDAAEGHEIWVVTPDDEVATWATSRRARVVADEGQGLNPVLESARDQAMRAGASSVLVLFADLPHVGPDDVEAMLDLPGCGVAIAPDEGGTGTNALHVAVPSSFAFAFGPDSFGRHLAQAPGALIVRRPGLSRDLDEIPDPLFAP